MITRLQYGIASFSVLVLLAHPSAVSSLTLSEAITTAMENNRGLQATNALASAARESVREARAASLPTLGASASYGTLDGDVLFGRFITDPTTGTAGGPIDVGANDTNQLVSLELVQVLYAGGARSAGRRVSTSEQRSAEEELRRQRLDLVFEVTTAYHRSLLTTMAVKVAAATVDRSVAGLGLVESRFAEEEALRVEVLGAEAQLAADRLMVLEAEHAKAMAKQALNHLLGNDLDEEISLEGTLEEPLGSPLDRKQVQLASSPELRLAELSVERAEAALGVGKGIGRPRLELRAGYQWIENDLIFDGTYSGLRLDLSVPIFRQALAGSAARARAAAHLDAARAQHGHTSSEVQLGTDSAFDELARAQSAIAVAEKNLEYHRERHRVSLEGYEESLLTFSELLDDHNTLTQAELRLNTAYFELRRAEARARRLTAVGG